MVEPLSAPSPYAVLERRDYFTFTAFTAKSRSRTARQSMYRATFFPIGLTSLLSEVCAPYLAQFHRDVKSFSPVFPHHLSDKAESGGYI